MVYNFRVISAIVSLHRFEFSCILIEANITSLGLDGSVFVTDSVQQGSDWLEAW